MRPIVAILLFSFAGQSPLAYSQQPIEKGAWAFKNGKAWRLPKLPQPAESSPRKSESGVACETTPVYNEGVNASGAGVFCRWELLNHEHG